MYNIEIIQVRDYQNSTRIRKAWVQTGTTIIKEKYCELVNEDANTRYNAC